MTSNVATKYPEKKVIICQAGPYILPRVPEAHDKVTAFWESLGNVEVHLNERVIEFDDMLQEYKTDKGNTFNAGKVIRATVTSPTRISSRMQTRTRRSPRHLTTRISSSATQTASAWVFQHLRLRRYRRRRVLWQNGSNKEWRKVP